MGTETGRRGHARAEWLVLSVVAALTAAVFYDASRSTRSVFGGFEIAALSLPYAVLGLVLAVVAVAGIPEWLEAKTDVGFSALSNFLWPVGIAIFVLPPGLCADQLMHHPAEPAARWLRAGGLALWAAAAGVLVWWRVRRKT